MSCFYKKQIDFLKKRGDKEEEKQTHYLKKYTKVNGNKYFFIMNTSS